MSIAFDPMLDGAADDRARKVLCDISNDMAIIESLGRYALGDSEAHLRARLTAAYERASAVRMTIRQALASRREP